MKWTMIRKFNFREPLFFRPPAQYAFRMRSHLQNLKKMELPQLENTSLLPVDRPYFLAVETESDVITLFDALSRFVPYRAAAFWTPRESGILMRIFAILGNGIPVPDDGDILADLMTPCLQRPPTWAELAAVHALLSGGKSDETVLDSPQIRTFFEASGGREAARMAFDRARARALEETIRIHRDTLVQKNCAVIAPVKRASRLGAAAERIPLWMPIAQALGERVFPVARVSGTGAAGNAFSFRVLPAFGGSPEDSNEPEWVQAARVLWNQSFQPDEKIS